MEHKRTGSGVRFPFAPSPFFFRAAASCAIGRRAVVDPFNVKPAEDYGLNGAQRLIFQLSDKEAESLRSQLVMSKRRRGGRRYLPYVFTEQGVAMLFMTSVAQETENRALSRGKSRGADRPSKCRCRYYLSVQSRAKKLLFSMSSRNRRSTKSWDLTLLARESVFAASSSTA